MDFVMDHMDHLDHLDNVDHLDLLDHLDHLDHLYHPDLRNMKLRVKLGGLLEGQFTKEINAKFALFT